MESTQSPNYKNLQLIVTAIITILVLGLLLWDYFHGGVPSHHILHKKDLPAISNWWNLLLMPTLTWILMGKTIKRMENQLVPVGQNKNNFTTVIWRFCIGLVFGILLSVSFANNYKTFLDYIPFILLILSLFIPIFYSEFILGFVIGMMFTFGAILPTVFILIMASVGFVLYKYIRPLFIKLSKVFTFLCVLLFCTAFISSQSTDIKIFQKLYSLEGVWLMKTKNGFIGEEWHKIDKNYIQSRGFYIKGRDTITTEKVSLKNTNDGIYYISTVEDQNKKLPISFKFTSVLNNTFIFENPEHDFPKRIVYEFIGNDSMHAYIDAGSKGSEARQDFYYRKVK